jgi:hypothetical protein
MCSRKRIGELLVDSGIISGKTLELALKIQKASGNLWESLSYPVYT